MNSVLVFESNAERMERLRGEFAILHALGLHLYPVGKDKMPLGKWVHGAVNYVQTQASLADAQEWSKSSAVTGWAVLCGNKNLRVFCLDVEAAGMAVPEIADLLGKIPDCYKRRSTSGGMHAWFRITEGEPVHTHPIAWNDGQLLAEVRGVSESDHAGAYAVVTGPGRRGRRSVPEAREASEGSQGHHRFPRGERDRNRGRHMPSGRGRLPVMDGRTRLRLDRNGELGWSALATPAGIRQAIIEHGVRERPRPGTRNPFRVCPVGEDREGIQRGASLRGSELSRRLCRGHDSG